MSDAGLETNPLKVLVSDTDTMAMLLLSAELHRYAGFEVFHCPASLSEICKSIAKHAVSVLLYGSSPQNLVLSGLQTLKQVRSESPGVRSIALMDYTDPSLTSELFRAGVKGVFERSEYEIQRLCHCIKSVSAGQVWANSQQLAAVLDAFAETSTVHDLGVRAGEMLTPRERDVVRLVADGYGNREIAEQLRLSSHTVKNYLFNIFEKLGVSNRAELIMYLLSSARTTAWPESRSRTQLSPPPPVRAARLPSLAAR